MPDYIGPHITRQEYECPCCKKLPPYFPARKPWIFDTFYEIRLEWSKPIPIGPPSGGGGYRCPLFNLGTGGSLLSVHLFGEALDLDLDNKKEVKQMKKLIERLFPELRMGIYTETGTFIHIDKGFLIEPQASENWEEGVRWHD